MREEIYFFICMLLKSRLKFFIEFKFEYLIKPIKIQNTHKSPNNTNSAYLLMFICLLKQP